MLEVKNCYTENGVVYNCVHEVKGLLFGTGCQWVDEGKCELHYGSYDQCQDNEVFMENIKKGLLGIKEQNMVYGYALVRMGNIYGKYKYFPLGLLKEQYLNGTIDNVHLAKLKKVCKKVKIKLEDLKLVV